MGKKQTLDIRELGPDDAAAYKRMRLEAASDPSFGIDPATEEAYTVELLGQALGQADGSYVSGAFDDDDMVAMVGFGRGMTPNTGTLFGLYVASRWRRRSIGTELCLALIERHPECSLRLEVLRINDGAIALYERLGFRQTGSPGETVVMIRPPGNG